MPQDVDFPFDVVVDAFFVRVAGLREEDAELAVGEARDDVAKGRFKGEVLAVSRRIEHRHAAGGIFDRKSVHHREDGGDAEAFGEEDDGHRLLRVEREFARRGGDFDHGARVDLFRQIAAQTPFGGRVARNLFHGEGERVVFGARRVREREGVRSEEPRFGDAGAHRDALTGQIGCYGTGVRRIEREARDALRERFATDHAEAAPRGLSGNA